MSRDVLVGSILIGLSPHINAARNVIHRSIVGGRWVVQLLAAGRRWLCSRPYLARCRFRADLCAAICTFGDEWLQKMCVLLAWIYVHLLSGGIGAAPFVSELEEVGQLLPLLPLLTAV